MKKDTKVTRVKFLMDKTEDNTGDVFALFPDLVYNREPSIVTCYAHIGQHSACSLEYASECKEATVKQYKDLYNELTNCIGYNLDIELPF